MPLSWNEIRTRAAAFVKEWENENYERGEAQTFWNEFFNVFGLPRKRLASFEQAVKKIDGHQGFIDLLWPGMLLVEHKSLGKNLERAEGQALDYFPGLKDEELPRYVLVSDFARFRLYDLEGDTHSEFPLADLLNHLDEFGFIAGYQRRTFDEQDPVNVKAAEKMGVLHDQFEVAGYAGHDLEVYLVRLLFCLFADDTGIFSPRGALEDFLETRTREDGSDLGGMLNQLFHVLNTPIENRQRTLDEQFGAFPYVNGALFEERLAPAAFSSSMRTALLDACSLDWGGISPAIFGSLFQSVMDAEERRHLGAHYTSEKNIIKLIGPLFLDDLKAELDKAGSNTKALQRFHNKLAGLRLLDPACGCGNFLVVAYRELRELEIETLKRIYKKDLDLGQRGFEFSAMLKVSVEQCFGIEIEEFPAKIAQVALWLVDHQMNHELVGAFGEYFTRLPLTRTAHILNDNALRVDWNTAFGEHQPEAFDYILGNPPFGGKKEQSADQKADLKPVLHGIKGAGVLDFVTGWYILAAKYMVDHPETVTAFVSTNSISQGEQVGVLWNELFNRYNAKLHFAHRTFRWTNEAKGKAAVHVVIEGFALFDRPGKRLFEYDDIAGDPHERTVGNINPYLVEGGDVVVLKRGAPLSNAPMIREGSALIDWGFFLLGDDEANALRVAHSEADDWIRPFCNGDDFISGVIRWCLWLEGVAPQAWRRVDFVRQRVEAIRDKRANSSRAATAKLAATPAVFGEIRQPDRNYLFIPKTSSENRDYIPMAFQKPTVVLNNTSLYIEGASNYQFGVLTSEMHMAWMRHVGGRLESRYRYSNTIVYNNFPWPEATGKLRETVEKAAQAVLDARKTFLDSGSTLADLYDPLAMPPVLVKAHTALDKAVDRCYRRQPFPNEAGRVAFLFERYETLTNALFAEEAKKKKRGKK